LEQKLIIMSDEKENLTPNEQNSTPKEKPVAATNKNLVLKKPAHNPFLKNANNFTSSKAGSSGKKGAAFKGGGMKKGK
jgi:hypothetical protein